MLKLDSIADAWIYYLENLPDTVTESQREKLRMIFYDGFGIALLFWRETYGAPDTFTILEREYLMSRLKENRESETSCAKD